ncbi:MAG: hypothetical protein QOE10_3079, partial [Gaiellales bacterium]|nr:hypothetical protein [Gaiellales bacterium]
AGSLVFGRPRHGAVVSQKVLREGEPFRAVPARLLLARRCIAKMRIGKAAIDCTLVVRDTAMVGPR